MIQRYEAVAANDEQYFLGEGAQWDAPRSRLLWVDILAGRVFEGRLDGERVVTTATHSFEGMVGTVVPAADGSLLVAAQEELVVIAPGGSRTTGPRFVPDGGASRANDGGVDPQGRMLIGTLRLDDGENVDTLQRVEFDGSLTMLDDDLHISNGLAWSADGSQLFSVDTIPQRIFVRDYPADAAAPVGERREFLRVTDGHPDGMTIDTDGNLWVAIWGGGEVRCYAPDGAILAVVETGSPHTSSVAFVGNNLDTLLITSALKDLTDEQLAHAPNAGRLLLAPVEARGVPTTLWAGLFG